MRVFYSHPIKQYGTPEERRGISLIEGRFVGCELINPSREPGRETEFYLGLVDGCDCLVFSRHHGYVTEGVRPEVEHALAKGKEVYELRGGRFIPVRGPVKNLPVAQRLLLRAKAALQRGQRELP